MSITKEFYWAHKSKPKHPACRVMDAGAAIELAYPTLSTAVIEKPKPVPFAYKYAGLGKYDPPKHKGLTSRYEHKPWPFKRKSK